ncbi:MAG: AbrB family transcriptional regulator [Quadrisphaera sp.]
MLGVLSGALLQPATLAELASSWAPVLAAVVATLLVSVLAGLLLGLRRDVDAATGSFAMVAGGASGLTAIAGELGADQRVVAVVQYLRVLIILLAMPVVAVLLGGGSSGAPPGGAGSGSGGGLTASAAPWWADVLFTAVVAAVGIWLARLAKLPAAPLLGPMVVAAAVSATGLTQGATVPGPVLQVAFALIGLQVGLSFTRSNLKDRRTGAAGGAGPHRAGHRGDGRGGRPAAPPGRCVHAGRVPGHHAGRALRGGGDLGGQRRRHHAGAGRPGAPPAGDAAAGAPHRCRPGSRRTTTAEAAGALKRPGARRRPRGRREAQTSTR